MNKIIPILICTVWSFILSGQETFSFTEALEWEGGRFAGSSSTHEAEPLPLYVKKFPLPSYGELQARLVSSNYESGGEWMNREGLPNAISVDAWIEVERRQVYGFIAFVPLRENGGSVERVRDFELRVNFSPLALNLSPNTRDNTYTSALADGEIYKIAVEEYGLHRMDRKFLSDLGVDVGSIDPRQIKLLGNGGGKLPHPNAATRYDDLQENAIFVSGGADGSFDSDDYILFYAEGANRKVLDVESKTMSYEQNPYDTRNYYFIKISPGNGLRVSDAASLPDTDYTSSSFNDFQRLEQEDRNLLHDNIFNSGSGTEWFGDKFGIVQERSYNFPFPNRDASSPVFLQARMMVRNASANNNNFTVSLGGASFNSNTITGVTTSNVESLYARAGEVNANTTIGGDNLAVTVRYNTPGGEAWLDYINVNVRRELSYDNAQLIFRDFETLAHNSSTFQIANANGNLEVWDITQPLQAKRQQANLSGNLLSFGTQTGNTLKEFIVFDRNGTFLNPIPIGSIANQNLHALDQIDALFIYHKDFEAAAQQLAQHRESHSGMTVALAEIGQVFNEFSSGSQDPVAIRDMARMLYQRGDPFRYLLLFGDGSFDYRNRYGFEDNSNYVPVFETEESMAPIFAFPSDDYYGLLDENEGGDLDGAMDIAVGRLTVASATDASRAVQKIIHYDTSPKTLGDWRNRLTFVADDEDGNTHIRQADGIANDTENEYGNFNINKIYFDAYKQQPSSGGDSYPGATAAINSSVFKGQLLVNYLGHGGPTSWAQERVLQETDINNWQNPDKLPLFVTATCSFAGYDDPTKVSAGERIFLRQNGGGIALFSTTRAVFASSNEALTLAVYEEVFERVDGEYPTIGEVLRRGKNNFIQGSTSDNARKFALIGDPTMHLALPTHQVQTLTVNGVPVADADTLSALGQVTVTGQVTDKQGNLLSSFNGTVFPTIFDKPQTISTLANDSGSSVRQFKVQRNIIFKGAASVTDGTFSFSFVVPKDIDYSYGNGKISYYAHDGVDTDAAGHEQGIVVGGTSSEPVQDDNPPLVEVFMDNEEFVFGGLTSTSPVLYVKLSDDYGMNVAGSGIGHDLTAVIDGNEQNTIVLNDFYESQVNNFTKGEARYPLSGIAPGRHTVRVKGWDIANNSGEGYTEFVVAESAEVTLDRVLNYPNPFTTSTDFQFEHNMAGQMLRVQVQIYTISGKLIKTISQDMFAEGHRMRGIYWDGRDDFGDRLGRGVYLYKITVGGFDNENISQSASSGFEKLVILK